MGKQTKEKATKEFTDRDEFIVAFTRALETQNRQTNKVLVFYGVGGIGKSSIIKKIQQVKKGQMIDAKLQMNNPSEQTIETGLMVLRNQLKKQIKDPKMFLLFDLAYVKYMKRFNPNTPIPKESFPFSEEGGIVVDLLSTLVDVPIIGIVPKILSLVGKTSTTVCNYYLQSKNEINKMKDLDLEEMEQCLLDYWAKDIRQYAKKQRLVIFIDTYEALPKDGNKVKDDWLFELVKKLPEVLWVICGIEKLRWDERGKDLEGSIEQHLIGDLVEKDCRIFLERRGITDTTIQDAIIQGSRGVPYYLDLAVDTYERILEGGSQPRPEDFALQLNHVLDRFIKHLEKGEVEMLKLLAIPRIITYEIATWLLRRFPMSFSITSFGQLMNFSFIEAFQEHGYTMHELMRKSLEEGQDKAFVCKVHGAMFDYYREYLNEMNQSVQEIKTYLREYMYHGLRSNKEAEIIQFMLAHQDKLLEVGEYELIKSYLEANQEERSDEEKFLLVKVYNIIGHYEKANALLETFRPMSYEKALQDWLELKIELDYRLHGIEKSMMHMLELYECLKKEDETLEILERLVNLLNKLGKTNVFKANYEEAQRYYQESIAYCEAALKKGGHIGFEVKMAQAYEQLGETYSELKCYEEAYATYTRALAMYKRAEQKQGGRDYNTLLGKGFAYKRLGENRMNIGNINEAIGCFEEAIRVYSKIRDERPELLEVYYKLGFASTDLVEALLKHNRYEIEYIEYLKQGIDAFEKVIQVTDKDRQAFNGLGGAYRCRGMIYHKLGNIEQAKSDFKCAIQYASESINYVPDHPYGYICRGKIYTCLAELYKEENEQEQRMGVVSLAIDDFEKALVYRPGDQKIKALLAAHKEWRSIVIGE